MNINLRYRNIPFFFLVSFAYFSCSQNSKNPNLLIIQTDEHNFRTLGCYRNTLPTERAFVWGEGIKVETPNIDYLADHGALCTSFYAATPVCSPSRASFMTGLYPQNTRVVTNNIPMDGQVTTFAAVLKQRGYFTGYAGKWHLDGLGKPQWKPERNFGFTDNQYMFNRGHWKQLMDTDVGPRVAARDRNFDPTYSVEGADSLNFTTDFLTNKTIEFIRNNGNTPFCYMVSYPDPHGPNAVRAPYDTMFDHLDFEKPKTASKSDEGLPRWAKKAERTITGPQMAQYFGMVKCIDDNVGKILNVLRETGQIENTIIVFTADHGDLCGEHGKDNKGNPFEASAKVPFIVHYPGSVLNGTIINEALSTVDFLPTILNLMEVSNANHGQGRDASALFKTGSVPDGWNDIVFLRGTGQRDNRPDVNWLAAVTDRYKLIFSPGDEPWLFDLQNDPDELINYYLDQDYKEIISDLSKSILDYGEKYNDPRIHEPKIRNELDHAIN